MPYWTYSRRKPLKQTINLPGGTLKKKGRQCHQDRIHMCSYPGNAK